MVMDSDVEEMTTKFTEQVVSQITEYVDGFLLETIMHWCEDQIKRRFIDKKELKRLLTNGLKFEQMMGMEHGR